MRELKVLNVFSQKAGRTLLAVETPEDMRGWTQAKAKQEIFGEKVILEINGVKGTHLVRGFEMMGMPEREIGDTMGIMVIERNDIQTKKD